jgi:hypothetical protein
MRRGMVMAGALAGGLMLATLADASPGIDLQLDRGSAARSIDRATAPQVELMRRWAGVARCVIGRDRNTSLTFVRAAAGSDDAYAAARRLDPIFASCLAGSGVPGPSSVVLRRAALAGALGIALRA